MMIVMIIVRVNNLRGLRLQVENMRYGREKIDYLGKWTLVEESYA